MQDLTLGIAMVRPSRRFLNDETMNGDVLTAGRYGAVRRVYVVAEEDEWKPAETQRLMASWNPGTEVVGLQGADHIAHVLQTQGALRIAHGDCQRQAELRISEASPTYMPGKL